MIFFSDTPNIEGELKKHDIEELESCADQMGLAGEQREIFIKNSLENMDKYVWEQYQNKD